MSFVVCEGSLEIVKEFTFNKIAEIRPCGPQLVVEVNGRLVVVLPGAVGCGQNEQGLTVNHNFGVLEELHVNFSPLGVGLVLDQSFPQLLEEELGELQNLLHIQKQEISFLLRQYSAKL